MSGATILLLCWVAKASPSNFVYTVDCMNGNLANCIAAPSADTPTCEVVSSLLDAGVTIHDNKNTTYKMYEVTPTKGGAATMKERALPTLKVE